MSAIGIGIVKVVTCRSTDIIQRILIRIGENIRRVGDMSLLEMAIGEEGEEKEEETEGWGDAAGAAAQTA